MTTSGTFSRGVIAMALFGAALAQTMPCQAEPADDGDFAALQADAKKSLKEGVTPFLTNYCVNCHGDKKSKAGINFESALNHPGETAARKRWKQALANVKTHDMPPDDVPKQPTEEERQKFVDWMA